MTRRLDPNNFLGHYNRGLLRAHVGDDNRAITDFDFVLKMEPDNLMALYNRALLLDKTGDLRAAINDYSKVIKRFPNFWTGLENRASCYRRLGMTKQAEEDEFKVYKARLYKHLYGVQPRMDRSQLRKRSDDEEMDKYNQIVVADQEENEHEYKNDYRGKVQNRKVNMEFLPMYELAYLPYVSEVKTYIPYNRRVDAFNAAHKRLHPLYIVCDPGGLSESDTRRHFEWIDSLSSRMPTAANNELQALLLQRGVAYAVTQNYEEASADLGACLQSDSALVLALWQRSVCSLRQSRFNQSQGKDGNLLYTQALADITNAIHIDPQNPYLFYNRANLYALRNDFAHAIEDYTRAIVIDQHLAEAFFNRGIARLKSNRTQEGIADLSKAGELGLYKAYSVIKQKKP